ncbi:MAG: AAA domain-containing protein [Candidatus Latescibacteria bacterium]|nr:AAA domain-containing protein [Candidatus Latescibacterota bacterium]
MPSTSPPPVPLHGTWRTYTTADGLASLKVDHIAEDRDGYLWFATSGGVSRFDGEAFRTSTPHDGLPANEVLYVLCDRQGRIWCSTPKGICWYDGQTWHPLMAGEAPLNYHVSSMYEDTQGRIWLAGNNGVDRKVLVAGYIEGTTYFDLGAALKEEYNRPKGSICWGIVQDRQGRIWLGFHNLILRYEDGRFVHFGPEDGLVRTSVLGWGVALAVDGEGTVWAGIGTDLWRCLEDTFEPVPLPLQNERAYIRKLQTDRQGRLWIGTHNGGLLCYDGQTMHPLAPEEGLPNNAANAICQDREGLLWVATSGGAFCYDLEALRIFGAQEGLPAIGIANLTEAQNGHLWMTFGSYIGREGPSAEKTVARYDGERFSFYGSDQWLGRCRITALCQDDAGYIWFGGVGLFDMAEQANTNLIEEVRLTCCDPESMQPVSDERFPLKGAQTVTAIARTDEGHPVFVYFEKDPKVYRPENNGFQIARYHGQVHEVLFEVALKEIPTSYISTLMADGHGGFFFTLSDLVREGDGPGDGIGHWHPAHGVRRYTQADGLVDDRTTDLALDLQGRLWIATLGGISCFDGKAFQNFTLADGLSCQRVLCACCDRQGRLWFGTEAGVVHTDGVVFQSMEARHLSPIFSVLEDRQAQLWFGTRESLVRYRRGTEAPRMRLLQVVADQIYKEIEALEITTPVRQVIFEFKGISFRTNPRDLLYTWRLDGIDSQWQPPSRDGRAYYADLPPGDYTFQVKAIDFDLNHSEPLALPLTILPDPRLEVLKETLKPNGRTEEFIGDSTTLAQVQHQLVQVGPTDMSVLIFGETGTGKGVAARALHRLSQRSGAFIPVNCGAIPDNLVESELFGHEKGAFTGADKRQLGKVELAQSGTLFLDEIGDMPLSAQVKLLRLLEEREFERVGGSQTLAADTRFVAATNRDLEQMVSVGDFRQDLYYRLRTFVVDLPPLRQRQEDIDLLAHYFLERFAAHLSRPVPEITPTAQAQLKAYTWPGNVRELEHLMQRAALICRDDRIEVEDLGLERPGGETTPGEGLFLPLAEQEKRYIERALVATNGVVFGEQGAAKLLDINPDTLRSRMRKHGIRRPQ